MKLIFILILLTVVISACQVTEITSFEECIDAGNPAMESYPRQCRDSISDKTFVEVIEYSWRSDGIELRQHESEGFYGCFGCGTQLCVDPIIEMKQVIEIEERHCNEDFEVVEV